VNRWLVEYRTAIRTCTLATNDVHYVCGRSRPHGTLLCIHNTLKSDTNRLKMSDPSFYLTTADEMWGWFGDVVPEALRNTLKVAEMCNVDLDSKGYHLPVFPVPEGHTAATYLRHLCEKGLGWRYPGGEGDPLLRERLERELTIIHNMGFDTYFLIVWDLCQYARHADIWWNVRGSGAGSLAAYCLGITNIDPIQNNLLFERFLNPGRQYARHRPGLPDNRRGEMISTRRKYGEDKVAAIITSGRWVRRLPCAM
jgi:DNA polymerase-3 subunit alpha